GYEVSSPYSEHEGSSPPEAAVEATPETTPIPDRPTTAPPSGLISAASRPLSSLILDNVQQGATVPMTDRSFPGSPIKKESSPIRYSAPEILLYSPSQPSSRKIDMLLADRNLVNEEYYAVEMKSVLSSTIRITNDLPSKDRTQSVISSPEYIRACGWCCKYDFAADSVDDFDVCDLEKSGSPCSSGGLHMPDNKSLCNFAIHMKYMRSRHISQCNSDSERFSPNNSPQDAVNYFVNSKGVSTRRKMKKPPTTKVTIETQTEDLTSMEQFPYEHLFLDVFPPLHRSQPDEQASPTESVNSLEERSPASVMRKQPRPVNCCKSISMQRLSAMTIK
ncbi:hamartin, partial [Sarracenia purpurea var. burkii]